MMRQRKPRFLKPDTLIDNKHNKTRKVNILLTYLPPPPTPPKLIKSEDAFCETIKIIKVK